jgi:hypothetical protein
MKMILISVLRFIMQGKERHTKNVIQGTSYKALASVLRRFLMGIVFYTTIGKERHTRHVRRFTSDCKTRQGTSDDTRQ